MLELPGSAEFRGAGLAGTGAGVVICWATKAGAILAEPVPWAAAVAPPLFR